jgi:hypothetical protein
MSEIGAKQKSSSSTNPKKKVKAIKKPWDERFWISSKPVDESYFEKSSN